MNQKLESILAEPTSTNRSIETMAECDHAGRMIDLASLRARRESVMGELVAMIPAEATKPTSSPASRMGR